MSMARNAIGVLSSIVLAACVTAPAEAQPGPAQRVMDTPSAAEIQAAQAHYAPYAFLIGEWVSTPAGPGGASMTIRQSFRWGPNRSYMTYMTYTRMGDAPEALHFDGVMVWNGAHQNLDFLFMHEPGSGGQESGAVHAEPDGSVIRETVLTEGDGSVNHYRQTLRQTGVNSAVTSLMHQTASGAWEPNFPGADHLVMTRAS